MAEGEAALAKMMERIRINMPRFEQCIRLLRAEIGELKAGKHDDRLREVAAMPVPDLVLHSALANSVEGGLPLPVAPRLSDTDDEDSSRTGQSDDEDEKDEEDGQERQQGGDQAAVDVGRDGKGEEGGLVEGSTGLDGQRQEGQGVDQPAQGKLGRQRRHAEENEEPDWNGKEHKPRGGDGVSTPVKPSAAAAAAAETAKHSNAKGNQPLCTPVDAESLAKMNGRSPCLASKSKSTTTAATPPHHKHRHRSNSSSRGGDDTYDSASSQNGTHAATRASPLRDRPPKVSVGGARTTPSASADSGAREGGSCSDSGDECRAIDGGGRIDSDSINGAAVGSTAITTAVRTPGPGSGKKKSCADGGKGSTNEETVESRNSNSNSKSTSTSNSNSNSKRGRKRPRVVVDLLSEKSARERKPRSREREDVDGGQREVEEQEGEKKKDSEGKPMKEGADSVDAAHFRRIALEVWERVYRHKFAVIFRKAVNPKDAPGYEKVIKKPMDLSLIRERIMSGALLSLDDMNRDLFVMCNNAMVFNGKGDPYFDYSKELRTYASEVIEEARRPGFVTADPGFDSVVAGARTSRARQPDHALRSSGHGGSSSSRGRSSQKGGGGGGRRSSRESDSASVAGDTGDESVKGGRRGGGAGRATERRKGGRGAAGKKGGRAQAAVSSGPESDSSRDDEEEEDVEQSSGASDSVGAAERKERTGKKRGAVGKGKKRAREGVDDSSEDDRSSARGRGRKPAKPVAKQTSTSKARASKKRSR